MMKIENTRLFDAAAVGSAVDACEMDALIIHGLVQAIEALDGSSGRQAVNARSALLTAVEKMVSDLAKDLGSLGHKASLAASS